MTKIIFIIIIAIIVFDYLLERLLDYLNSKLWSNELPKELSGIYDAEKYKKSQDYEKAHHKLSLISESVVFVLMLFILIFNCFAIVDNYARLYSTNPIIIALIFFAIIGFAGDLINTPFSLYSTFIIEEKFGFNRTSIKTYIMDKLKGWLIAVLLGCIILSVLIWFYISAGKLFWVYAWVAVSFFMIFMSMFYSNIIVPLFNKQTPLEEGELKDAIKNFAEKAKFKLDNIYVIDGSKRSTKANAYFTGLGSKKRIVLFDTLIKNHTTEELVAVLAHEIGHYKLKHTLVGLIMSIMQTGLMFYIFSLFVNYPELSYALGANLNSFHIGLVAFGLLYSPISMILGLISNILSRKHEYAADKFAGTNYNPESLQLALKKLSIDNLSNLRPHPVYVFFHYSHPPLLERLEALERLKK